MLKLTTTIIFVLLLSYLAEHVSPEISGVISGIPTGSAIILFFYGLEQGTFFAANSAAFNLAAMLCMHIFIYVYYMLSSRDSWLNVFFASLISCLAYLLSAFFLKQFQLNIFISVTISIASIMIFSRIFAHIKNSRITRPVRLGYIALFGRAGIAASIVLLITGIAAMIGKEWAGLLSAFPTTILPLLIIVHGAYGKENVHTIIKNIPRGSWAMLIYVVGVYYLYNMTGIYLGTIICYAGVIAYLLILSRICKPKVIVSD